MTIQFIAQNEALEYFSAPEPHYLERWCREHNYSGVYPTQDLEGGPSDHALAAALYYAKSKHPEANELDVCSFATLVAYLATGWYGGFGTESYETERQAQNIVIALAGGITAPASIVSTVPESVVKGSPSAEFTRTVLTFLDNFYFSGDQEEAVANLLNTVDDKTAARIVLSLARTRAEYERLAKTADAFLKKKTNIASLRKAVRAIFTKG